MMDDYNYGSGNDDGNVVDDVNVRTVSGHRKWPVSSTDIVEYDSSIAEDVPSLLQQQQTQCLLPQKQQQPQYQQQRNNNNLFSQNSGAAVTANYSNDRYAGRTTIRPSMAEESSNVGLKSKIKWKTRALYAFLVCLLAIVVVNLTLTLWFIRVTQFTSEGIGSIKITQGGIQLSGRTLVTDRLVASAIRSRVGHPLLIESSANITLNARNSQGRLVNSLKLTKDGLECAQANVFRVTDTRGEILFSADRSKVIVGAQELRVTGSGGAVFQGSVQTPMVRADSRHDLRLESLSRRLELSGPQGVTIESRAGDIIVSCLMDVKLESIAGAIQIDAAKVFLKGLKTAKTSVNSASPRSTLSDPGRSSSSSSSSSLTSSDVPVNDDNIPNDGLRNSVGIETDGNDGDRNAKKRSVEDMKLPSVYQLCVCGNGKVFMSPPDGQCAADNESLVCR